MDYNPPGSSVHGFPRQEYWSGLPFPSPGDLLQPGTEPMSPALEGRLFATESQFTNESHLILHLSLLVEFCILIQYSCYYLPCSDVLFLHDLVLIGFMFLEIYSFILGSPIC